MRVRLLVTLVTFLVLGTAARADTTWGIGVGPLYSGLGLNFGRTTPSSLSYTSLGCTSLSSGDQSNTSTGDSQSNCGLGIGHISTSLFSSDRHGLGLNLGVSYNTDKSQTELRLRPGYHYFFKGISNSGLNLGIGAILYYDNDSSNDLDTDSDKMFLNIGYQF